MELYLFLGVIASFCLAIATYGMVYSTNGWGWFLFLAIVLLVALVEKLSKL